MDAKNDLDETLAFLSRDDYEYALHGYMISHHTLELWALHRPSKTSKYVLLEGVEYLKCLPRLEKCCTAFSK